jgi:hypothetical protein
MSAANDETSPSGLPLAVPGFASLHWREPVIIPMEPRAVRPQLVTRTDGAGLVFCGGRSQSEITSLALDGAFTMWPPKIGAPAAHALREPYNSPPRVARWLDDKLIFLGEEPFAAGWGVPGAESLGIDVMRRNEHGQVMNRPVPKTGRPYVGAPEHGIYVVRRVGEASHVFHHAATAPDIGVDLGAAPGAASHATVLDDGSLLFAALDRPSGAPKQRHVPGGRRPPPTYYGVRLFRAHEGRFDALGDLALPPQTNLQEVIASTGGAWLFLSGEGGTFAKRLRATGEIVGPTWEMPFAAARSILERVRWNDGFAFADMRSHVAVLASDGVHTSRTATTAPGERDVNQSLSIVAAPDGSSLLVAHQTMKGIELLRADFAPEAPTVDVWADDRAATIRSKEAAAARAAAPPRLPGRPIETTTDGTPPPRSHARERIIERARLHHMLTTIWNLHHEHGEPTRFGAKDDEGAFMHHDGSGNMTFIAWSDAGLVAGGFDGDKSAPGDGDPDTKSPEQCFPDAPAALAPLVAQIIQMSRGQLTGGLWVTAGEGARYHEEGEFTDDFPRYTMTAEAALTAEGYGHPWGVDLAPWGAIAATLADRAATGPHTVTAEEEAELLAARNDGEAPEPTRSEAEAIDERRLLFAARSLAAAGISWPAAEARGRAALEQKKQAALDALGEPQVALLRASNDGDAPGVKQLLEQGADRRCVAFEGMFDRTVEQVRYLARVTPLALATLRGHVDVVDALLATLPEGEAAASAESDATRIAVLKGDAAMLTRLAERLPLDQGLYQLAVSDVAGARGLREAPSLDVVRLLLDRGLVPHTRWAIEIASVAEAAGDDALATRLRELAAASTPDGGGPRGGRRER